MSRTILGLGLVAVASCGTTSKITTTAAPGPGSGAGSADVVSTALATTTVDQGQFGHYLGDRMIGAEEFTVERNALGYRITAHHESRSGRTEIELITDLTFATVGATMSAKIPGAPAAEGSGVGSAAAPAEFALSSTVYRDPKGHMVSEFNNGRTTETTTSPRPVDWFIGGPFTSILLPICARTETETTGFLVFPDDTVDVFAPTTVVLEGGKRTITLHRIRFASTGKTSYVACEGSKIVGDRTGKQSSARRDDKAVLAALAQLPI